jgi:DNA-binding MarR family transcriptional regulator
MAAVLGLREKLSRLLIAWTIEFDNAFEERLLATWARPFLVSASMWANVMQYVSASGTDIGELARRGGITQKSLLSILGGLERWGYVHIDHHPMQGHPGRRKGFGTAQGLKPTTVVYPSAVGALSQGIWQPLAAEIDQRWQRRDEAGIDSLSGALANVTALHGRDLPAFLPVLNSPGLFSEPVLEDASTDSADPVGLSSLLSRVLLALTIDIEREMVLSLPVSANLLRVLNTEPTPARDLPVAVGVSQEAISLITGLLEKQGAVRVEPSVAGRGKVLTMTEAGRVIREQLHARSAQVEAEWGQRMGSTFEALREAVDALHRDDFLRAALEPGETSWRVQKRYAPLTSAFVDVPTAALAHHPVVLHRGGWPDGS